MKPEPEVVQLEARMTTATSLYIGATADREAGSGRDLTVLRNPLDNLPLIPGSSLRGRMASLMWAYGATAPVDSIPRIDEHAMSTLFGSPAQRSALAFWDCLPAAPWVYEHRAAGLPLTYWRGEMAPPSQNAGFRRRELVCAGVHFGFRLTVLTRQACAAGLPLPATLKMVRLGLRLLERYGIGGSTARGMGRVQFAEIVATSIPPGNVVW